MVVGVISDEVGQLMARTGSGGRSDGHVDTKAADG